MNFSTNQVMQLFVLGANESAEVKPILALDKETVRGYIVQIKNEKGEVIDTTDIIDAKNILSVTEALASNDKLKRKGLLVKLNEGLLIEDEEGVKRPVSGEDYVMTLTYRSFGEEDTYAKVVSARAKRGDTQATLLQKLAESLILNADVEVTPLYELYLANGTAITANNLNLITDAGFYIVEPKPYWSLGRFAETLMNVEVQTAPIMVDSESEIAWLSEYKFKPVTIKGVNAIPNTHKVADLEYFCKGERGTSNALVGWPDTPDYIAKVNPNSANGYDMLTVHCAFVGANASNQKSEKDIIFVAEGGTASLNSKLSGIKAEITA